MTNLILERVELARRGQSPNVICRMASGWLVIADVQPLPGFCVLMADPVVESIDALDRAQRSQYSPDAIEVGDSLLVVTDTYRIDYETVGGLPGMSTIGRLPDDSIRPRRERLSNACAVV